MKASRDLFRLVINTIYIFKRKGKQKSYIELFLGGYSWTSSNKSISKVVGILEELFFQT
jgi:hypothetical protein